MGRLRVSSWLGSLLAGIFLLGGCSSPAAPIPPSLTPAVAAPVEKPIDMVPRHMKIPSIGVDADIEGLGLTADHQLDIVPLNAHPQHIGWYIYGPPPGSAGPALLASHVDWQGQQGAFFHLDNLKVGSKVLVSRGAGPDLSYTVTKTLTWPKDQFDKLHLYDPTSDSELRLVTCGGSLDRVHHNYLSNVIVWAKLDNA